MAQHVGGTTTIFPLPGEDAASIREHHLPATEDIQQNLQVIGILSEIDPPAALSALQALVSRTTDSELHAICYVRAGAARERLGQFEAAADCYREAAAREPHDRDALYLSHNNLGYCLNRLGRHAEAEGWCRGAIRIDRDRHNAHKNLAIALEATARFADAASSYLTAIHLMPQDPRAKRHLRILLVEHPEIARNDPKLAKEAAQLRPKDGETSRPVDDPVVHEVIGRLVAARVAEPVSASGLQVFGLEWNGGRGLRYQTLDDAMSANTLRVTELSESGQVPTIHVINESDERVFLMAGEELVGAKQNRVLNSSIMLDARVDQPLPVSCVEHGRWAYRSRGFSSKDTSSHAILRAMMTSQVHDSYRVHGKPMSNQGEVWAEVARFLGRHKTASPSGAMHAAYEKLGRRLGKVAEEIPVGKAWSGAVFASGGAIVGMDLFDSPATLAKLWKKLLKAYAVDAAENGGAAVSRDDVETWLKGASRGVIEAFTSPGLGEDLRLEGRRLIGAILLVEEQPVHVQMFAQEEN